MPSPARWIDLCNAYNPGDYAPFRAGSRRVGLIAKTVVPALADYPQALTVEESGVTLNPVLATCAERSDALAETVADLAGRGLIAHRRDESYPVFGRDVLADITPGNRPVPPDFEAEPLFLIDRGAVRFFGLPAWGVHLNGYIRAEDDRTGSGKMKIWSARRAEDRIMNPGQLDNMVAGGQPWGLSFAANLAKEAAEEAAIGPDLIAQAQPTAAIAYCVATEEGLSPATMICYDLALPADFRPRCADGEIECFHLWSAAETLRVIAETDEFKPNANLCGLDFLLRHGGVPADHPDRPALEAAFGDRSIPVSITIETGKN